jgi:hypothetical protein
VFIVGSFETGAKLAIDGGDDIGIAVPCGIDTTQEYGAARGIRTGFAAAQGVGSAVAG